MQQDLVAFAQSLVKIKSYSGQEEPAIRLVEQRMKALGFDEVVLDAMGNVLGRMGDGPKSILLDAHVDTVEVNDEDAWEIPPFSGEIRNGRLHGRGSVDMKSSIAASVYAAVLAKQSGWIKGKTVWVSCTVFEEDCDGENLKHLFKERTLRPDSVIICEPSNNIISLGHKGKIQFTITTHGVSAHGSAPDKGVNAVYEMSEIIQRAEALNTNIMQREGKPTLVLSKISSVSASLNAVPSECEIYVDRRIVPGETEAEIKKEIESLIAGKRASWKLGTLHRTAWTGLPIVYEPFHLAWKIDQDHPLTQACSAAYQQTFSKAPDQFDFWDFSTNAVTPVSMGIPTIGFGPGDYKMAHMKDESCPISQIIDACRFYASVMEKI